MDKEIAYLVGLMCARGHIFGDDKRIILEFAHKNKTIEGIAYCPKCGDFATEKKDNNEKDNLICKSCNSKVDKSVKKVYEQKESTLDSIQEEIIPFLKKKIDVNFEVVGNDHMTFLILNFNLNDKNFEIIKSMFKGKTSFDSFEIPLEIYRTGRSTKVEFVNGFMDSAGFFNSGGWLNRNGKYGSGRMRAYLQIVRNWKMPVLICNFLKKDMSLPIHTIDWGHPNIRDSDMEDYYNSNPLSWSREHQVKFFPEYYAQFKLRLDHKQKMFNELREHNRKVGFDNNDDCNPPKPIGLGKLKPYHFGENDKRIPKQVRKHCDAYWQVCDDMGCIFSDKNISKSENKEIYYLTGKDQDLNLKEIEKEFNNKRKKITKAIIKKNQNKIKTKESKITKEQRKNPEQRLYEPISRWFKGYLKLNSFENTKVHDTSAYYLDKFILQNDLYDEFSFCDRFKIKPDIVGFLLDKKQLGFVEVKISELSLKDIGQLMGYCLVALPEFALLISPKKPSINLIKILKSNPYLLNYSANKKIKIGTWNKNECKLLEF